MAAWCCCAEVLLYMLQDVSTGGQLGRLVLAVWAVQDVALQQQVAAAGGQEVCEGHTCSAGLLTRVRSEEIEFNCRQRRVTGESASTAGFCLSPPPSIFLSTALPCYQMHSVTASHPRGLRTCALLWVLGQD